MLGMAPPPSTRSSLRGKGHSGADPTRSGKTHPGALRSATRNKGGRTLNHDLIVTQHPKANTSSTASDEVTYIQCPVIYCCVANYPKV